MLIRGNITTLAFVIACIGGGLGLILYAGANPAYPIAEPYVGTPLVPVPTIRPTMTAAQRLIVGNVGAFSQDIVVWVDEIGLAAYRRADANRDEKGVSQSLSLWETFMIPSGALVKITNQRGSATQFEVLGGEYAGRRGWTDSGVLFTPQR